MSTAPRGSTSPASTGSRRLAAQCDLLLVRIQQIRVVVLGREDAQDPQCVRVNDIVPIDGDDVGAARVFERKRLPPMMCRLSSTRQKRMRGSRAATSRQVCCVSDRWEPLSSRTHSKSS